MTTSCTVNGLSIFFLFQSKLEQVQIQFPQDNLCLNDHLDNMMVEVRETTPSLGYMCTDYVFLEFGSNSQVLSESDHVPYKGWWRRERRDHQRVYHTSTPPSQRNTLHIKVSNNHNVCVCECACVRVCVCVCMHVCEGTCMVVHVWWFCLSVMQSTARSWQGSRCHRWCRSQEHQDVHTGRSSSYIRGTHMSTHSYKHSSDFMLISTGDQAGTDSTRPLPLHVQ